MHVFREVNIIAFRFFDYFKELVLFVFTWEIPA